MKSMGLDLGDDDELPRAVISEDENYRYFLSRIWGKGGKTIAFIGLNPSTADAVNDDPTIRRCVGFAKAWGGTSLLMVNLFAFRATYPSDLVKSPDPVGPENDYWLERCIACADLAIAAWGNDGDLLGRAQTVSSRFHGSLHALAITKKGMPGHPLYLPKDAIPKKFVVGHHIDAV